MISDSFKTLARKFNRTPGEIRHIAKDLGLFANYSSERRTWFLDENATVVRMFNEHLATLAD